MAVLTELHDYILNLIEKELRPGEKLPGARSIAERFSCSLPRVQTVLDSLEQSGVVESRPRSGTYVSSDYKERNLPRNVVCSSFINALSAEQIQRFRTLFPELHLTKVFRNGGVEILSSFTILSRLGNYQDLTEIFEETFPEGEKRFFMESLEPFRFNGKLYAVPIMFSPQILWYNPELFRKTNTPFPTNAWGEKEFFSAIRQLHKTLSGRRIINYTPAFQHWSNFIHASGGIFFDPKLPEPVQTAAPGTVEACCKYAELLRELDLVEDYNIDPIESFAQGKLAMFSGFRQSAYYFREKGISFTPGAVFMPSLGTAEKQLGAGLIAFRNSFHDREKIKEMLRFWLSDSIQQTLGESSYGIPFLRSAAQATLDPAREPDRFLLEKLPALSTNCHIHSEILGSILSKASALINTAEPSQIPEILNELATTLRFIVKINR